MVMLCHGHSPSRSGGGSLCIIRVETESAPQAETGRPKAALASQPARAALASDRCARSSRLHPRLSRPDPDAAADLCLQPDLSRLPRQLSLRLAHRAFPRRAARLRSEEHTSELQSLMRISYAVFCLKKKKNTHLHDNNIINLIKHLS